MSAQAAVHVQQPTPAPTHSAQKTGLALIPAACTSAASVRKHVIEPAMEVIALEREERELLREERALLVRLAVIAKRREKLSERREAAAREITGCAGPAADRLDLAERTKVYTPPTLVSEARNFQKIADKVNVYLDRLKDPAQAHKHGYTRDYLHSIFESHGDDLIASKQFRDRTGNKRRDQFLQEFEFWKAGQS